MYEHYEVIKQYLDDCKNYNHPWRFWTVENTWANGPLKFVPGYKYQRSPEESRFTSDQLSVFEQYLEECKTSSTPWTAFERFDSTSKNWVKCDEPLMLTDTVSYRKAQKTSSINGVEYPLGVTQVPKFGTEYWCINMALDSGVDHKTWNNNEDINLLKRGYVHLSETNALAHVNALLSASTDENLSHNDKLSNIDDEPSKMLQRWLASQFK